MPVAILDRDIVLMYERRNRITKKQPEIEEPAQQKGVKKNEMI